MSFDRPNYTSIQVFHFKSSVKKNAPKKFVLTNNFFCNPNSWLCIARKPVYPVPWRTNTMWCLYLFWALFVLYEVQLDNKSRNYQVRIYSHKREHSWDFNSQLLKQSKVHAFVFVLVFMSFGASGDIRIHAPISWIYYPMQPLDLYNGNAFSSLTKTQTSKTQISDPQKLRHSRCVENSDPQRTQIH